MREKPSLGFVHCVHSLSLALHPPRPHPTDRILARTCGRIRTECAREFRGLSQSTKRWPVMQIIGSTVVRPSDVVPGLLHQFPDLDAVPVLERFTVESAPDRPPIERGLTRQQLDLLGREVR